MLNPLGRIFRFAFHQLYNQFAFTYDRFSDIVSRGEWWTWTGAGIPFLRGTRILEVASGSGNLHLDLYDAGYVPIGMDLSPYMLEITRRKSARKSIVPWMNTAYSVTGVCAKPGVESVWQALRNVENGMLMQMWDWRVEAIENPRSRIHVFLTTKRT